MYDKLAETGMVTFRKVLDLWRGSKSQSLIDYTRSSRVEPLTLIDESLIFNTEMNDVLNSLLNQFVAYYLQAVSVSTVVGNIEVMRQLDKLNPNRSATDALATGAGTLYLLSNEAYEDRMPNGLQVSMEADASDGDAGGKFKDQLKKTDAKAAKLGPSATAPKDSADVVKELANLAVGKLVNIEITDGEKKAQIPVQFRLITNSVPSEHLAHILSVGSQDNTVKERWHGWKSGRLRFWRDLVLCQDLIDAHRRNLMNDKSGVLSSIMSRRRGNDAAALASLNPSVATASNLVVLSKETLARLELQVNGKFSSFKVREKVFQETYLMIVAVMDLQFNRIVFYHRGIPQPTDLSLKDLKVSNKGTGPNIGDMLKDLGLGLAPSL